ncbi:MAG: cadherin-like domain-containing protein, partial [Methylococcales bacterium]|nr:cadherin-like domain-containing protein [Methylococcales bacterium]
MSNSNNQSPIGNPTATLQNGKQNSIYTFNAADLLQGFTDADGDTLSIVSLSVDNGDVVFDGEKGTVAPATDFNGVVNLDYVVGDNLGGDISATQQFSVIGATVNHAPTGKSTATLANGKQNSSYTFNAADLLRGLTDADGDTLSVVSVSVDNGEIVFDGEKGTVTPTTDFNGVVNLDYVVSDNLGGEISATQTFSLVANSMMNHAPTGNSTATLVNGKQNATYTLNASDLLQGFNDADGDTLNVVSLSVDNGEIVFDGDKGTFTPTTDFNGVVNLDYVISDNLGGEISAAQQFSIGDAPTIIIPKTNVPHAGDVSIIGDLMQNKTLTINNTLADADGLGTFTYQWLKNGVPISGATQNSYTLTESDVGKTIKITVSFIDGGNTLETATSKATDVIQAITPSNGKIEQGDSGNNLIIGTGKNDQLSGLAGADTLRGNAGNDILDGGSGNDLLEGGNGDDVLTGGSDNDKLLGGSGNDSLMGDAGNDTLEGGAGKDTLNGGAGVDSMTGGDGDDYYFVDNSKDRVIETNKSVILGGKDTVKATSSYTLGENIENLILDDPEGKGFNGTGNKSDNVIVGNIGDDVLNGMAGNDKLDGGEGDDTLDGGLGIDTVIGGNGSDGYYMNNLGDQII